MYYRIPDEYFIPVTEVKDLQLEASNLVARKAYRSERVEKIIREVMNNDELSLLEEADEEFMQSEIEKG